MIFIPPMEIATRVMTLIENAKTELILVSPYINIDNWTKFKKCLQRAIDRGVNITIYARENASQNLDTIRVLKVNLVLVRDLHAKIYLNDSYAIASSQNLIQYSDDNSIDFGYSTETAEEREQLMSLINQYLIVSKPNMSASKVVEEVEEKREINQEDETVFLKSFEIKKIYKAFVEKYDRVRIDSDSTYVYCSKLFSFGDVMLREGLEIRFNKQYDIISLCKIIQSLDFKFNHYKYEINVEMKNGYPSTIMFKPLNIADIQNLIYDYLFICYKIKEETKHLVVK